MGDEVIHDEIHECCKELLLSDAQVSEMMNRFLQDIQLGLGKDTHASSIVKCFVTYVQDLPNGTERGKFLALDLGGTNFRVLLIVLGENKHFDMKSKIYAIPQSIMLGSGTQLFDHIAECLANFMKEHNTGEERLPLGFTFSFPLKQKGLTKGMLERWTKGFDCSGCVGEDVVQLLKDALSRRNDTHKIRVAGILNDAVGTLMSCAHRRESCRIGVVVGAVFRCVAVHRFSPFDLSVIHHLIHFIFQDVQIDVCAVLNDTTGTLMSCAWKNSNCKIGIIVGTGSNACYVERVENADLFDGDRSKPYVVINTEWGAFGDDGRLDIIRTEYDHEIDQHSINPGKQLFEKMISGMYMGELARLIIVKFTKQGLLFGGKGSDMLFKRDNFFTKYVSEIESDKEGSHENCRQVLDELGLSHATDQDCSNVRYICECVSKRAAHLVSAGAATLINKMGQDNVTVGIDGSVYRFHPHFHDLMMEKIRQLITPGIKFDIMLSEDGSGRGAALVAAVACRDR